MSMQRDEFGEATHAEELADAAAAGELIYGETLDADAVLPSSQTESDG